MHENLDETAWLESNCNPFEWKPSMQSHNRMAARAIDECLNGAQLFINLT
jgi:hypothetical protein